MWVTSEPTVWPEPPVEMTYTALTQMERCPRQWALTAASYPNIWNGHGYPQRVHVVGLAGQVLHSAVEVILKALTTSGCASVYEPAAFGVMKALGGYSAVINEAIDRVLSDCGENPRALPIMESAGRMLRARVQELRGQAQTLVSRVSLAAKVPSGEQPRHGERKRGPLTAGAFSELDLQAHELHWKGRVDLLVVSSKGCEITDFKTGREDPAHVFQVQLYALLWRLDRDRNPDGRPATRLIVAYAGRDRDVAVPESAELERLQDEVMARTEAARSAVTVRPPETRPSLAHCTFCGVRQLCRDYWELPEQEERQDDRRWLDLQVKIVRPHGPSSWDATIERTPGQALFSRKVLIRTAGDATFRTGDRIRILDAGLQDLDDDGLDGREPDTLIVTLNAASEVYAMP